MKLYHLYFVGTSGKHQLQAIGNLKSCVGEYNRLVNLYKRHGCVSRPSLKRKLIAPNNCFSTPNDVRGCEVKRWAILYQNAPVVRSYEFYIVEAGEL